MADPGALHCLIKALGDPTKMVQARLCLRGANDSLATPGCRAGWAQTRSPPLWPRRTRALAGARRRVFNQHFRDLTDDSQLLAALERDLNDPVPYVRFEAAGGLWRWYYWQVDKPETRRSTLEALATRLNTETDPMVRRGA